MKKLLLLILIWGVLFSAYGVEQKQTMSGKSLKGIPVVPVSLEYMPVVVNYFSQIIGMKFIVFSGVNGCDLYRPLVLSGKTKKEQIKIFIDACNKDTDKELQTSYIIKDNFVIFFDSVTSPKKITEILNSRLEILKMGKTKFLHLKPSNEENYDNYYINDAVRNTLFNSDMVGKSFFELIKFYYKKHMIQGMFIGVNKFQLFKKSVVPKPSELIRSLTDLNRVTKEEKNNLFVAVCYLLDYERDEMCSALAASDWTQFLTYSPHKYIGELRYFIFKRFSKIKNDKKIKDFLVNSFLASKDSTFKYKVLSQGLLPEVDETLYREKEIRKNCLSSDNAKLKGYFNKKTIKPAPIVIDRQGALKIKTGTFVQPEIKKMFKRTIKSTYLKEVDTPEEYKEVSVEIEYECSKYKQPFIAEKISDKEVNYSKTPEQAALSYFSTKMLLHKTVQDSIASLKGTKDHFMVFEYRVDFKSNGHPAVILFGYGYKKKMNQLVKSDRSYALLWNGKKWEDITELGYDNKNTLNITLVDNQYLKDGSSFFDYKGQ